ncbi:MAG: hypothetical protein ACFBRM_03335 [Pikeienuella sp.]
MTERDDLDALFVATAPKVSAERAAKVAEQVLQQLGPQEASVRITFDWLIAPLQPLALGGAVAAALCAGILVGALIDLSPDPAGVALQIVSAGGL